jgi:uncharacterized RDD family membrane protein YckC
MSADRTTGFAKIYYDRKLQDYWLRRLVAIIIDSVLISIATLILVVIIFWASSVSMPWWGTNGFVFSFFSGIPLFLYSALTENIYGYTLGKRIMNLKVVKGEGRRPPMNIAFLRNVTKIYGLALLLDVVIALALPNRDPTQKYTDTYAGTMVISAT